MCEEVNNIQETIINLLVLCSGCAKNEITADKHLVDDLFMDSMALLDLVLLVGEKFSFEFSEQDIEKIETVSDLFAITQRNMIKSSSSQY